MRLIPSGCSEAIDAIPTSVHPQAGNGWCFIFGEGKATEGSTGREVGAAYLIPGKPHYTRSKVIASPRDKDSDQPMPKLRLGRERPLTAEEVAPFEQRQPPTILRPNMGWLRG